MGCGSLTVDFYGSGIKIFEHIGCSCNRARIHSALGNLGPEEFEARHMEEAAAAA